jgi:hypothetical protein
MWVLVAVDIELHVSVCAFLRRWWRYKRLYLFGPYTDTDIDAHQCPTNQCKYEENIHIIYIILKSSTWNPENSEPLPLISFSKSFLQRNSIIYNTFSPPVVAGRGRTGSATYANSPLTPAGLPVYSHNLTILVPVLSNWRHSIQYMANECLITAFSMQIRHHQLLTEETPRCSPPMLRPINPYVPRFAGDVSTFLSDAFSSPFFACLLS